MYLKIWAFAIGVCLVPFGDASAAVVEFRFGDSGTGNNSTAYSEAPTATAAGLTVSNFLDSGGATAVYDGNASTDRDSTAPQVSLRANAADGSPTTAAQLELHHDEGRYAYFDVTVDPLSELNLTNLTFDYSRGTGSGSTGRWVGFATSLDTDAIYTDEPATNRPDYKPANVDLSGSTYQGLTGTVRFKFFSVGTTIDADNIVLNGTVVPVPEPSAAALVGLAAIPLAGRRRRPRHR